MKKEKSFPSIIGLILLLSCVVAGVFLTSKKTFFSPQASGDCKPDNIQLTNLTHRSVAISFITSADCLSSINIDNHTYSNNFGSIANKVHYFELNDLQSSKKYEYSLVVGGKSYTSNQYTFTTASTPSSSIPSSNLAWGKVFTSDHKPANNVIVYLNISGASPLSAPTTNDGNWNISLANSFDDSLTNWFTSPSSPVSEDIVVINNLGITTQINHNSSRNNPVPDIIIGQNSLEVDNTILPDVGNLNVGLGKTSSAILALSITNPREGDTVTSLRPEFFGLAPINTAVTINIGSVTGQSISDSKGNWRYNPTTNLSNGKQVLTVKILNQSTNVWTTITRNFTVLANVSGPAFTSTPSATATITASPTPTLEPTIIPTNTPKPRSSVISTSTATPVTGNALPTTIIITTAVLFIFISYYLYIR